jgi:uridine phosphorylase
MEQSSDLDWELHIREIAGSWLFSDLPTKQLPPVVLLPFENPDLHDRSLFSSLLSEIREFRSVWLARYRGCQLAILNSRFGSPAVAMTVDLLSDLGVRALLGIGFCGAINQKINCGDLVLPLACVRDEGTCTHYVPLSYPAVVSPECFFSLREKVASCGHPWHSGLVWSTDAVLLETSDKVEVQNKRHVLAVDMECSTLFTISRLKGIAAAAILVASDHPGRRQLADPNLVAKGLGHAARVLLDTAVHLSC